MGYKLKYAHQADKDARKLEQEGLHKNAIKLLAIIKINPFQNPPPYEKLKGKLEDTYSRRINKQHRLVYEVQPNIDNLIDKNGELYEGIVKVLRMWTHYE
jgi:Txe/YoeB family toxin of toxin-antitoxin system